jgi:hypothetical protein
LGNLANVSFTEHQTVNGGQVTINGLTGGSTADSLDPATILDA